MRRQVLLMTVLLVGTGCQGLHDRVHCRNACTEPCQAPEKCVVAAEKPRETTKVSEKLPAPRTEAAPAQAAIAQEVLLVPRMVYMPFVAQAPTGVARLTSNMTVMPPAGTPPPVTAPPPAGTPPPVTAPPPAGPCPEEVMLDMCKKLNHRLDCMEKCIKERDTAPTMICPPQPFFPLFRRPLFSRFDPVAPQCETFQPCEQGTPGAPPQRAMPATSSAPEILETPRASIHLPSPATSTGPEILQRMPTRAPSGNTQAPPLVIE